MFAGRSRELGRLRAALDHTSSSVVRVVGIRGGGKSALVSHLMDGVEGALHVCPPLPDSAQRSALATTLSHAVRDAERVPEWTEIFATLDRTVAASGRPFVLVLDDAHRLGEARSRITRPLSDAIGARREGPPLHVVMVGPAQGLPDLTDDLPAPADTVRVGPLPLRSAAPMLPGSRPLDKLLAYGVFGGLPRVLATLDRSVSITTNLRRLALDPDGSLADAGGLWLERDLQAPARYYALMSALACGEADWSTLHAALPDVDRGGQIAPYLARLSTLELIETHRSLDAPARSRSTRYAITDPFLAFWFRYVLPMRATPGVSPQEHHNLAIRPTLDHHMETVMPIVARQHMSHDAIETLGANAREIGALWGHGYDVPVAGLLATGAAFYGASWWTAPDRDARPAPLSRIERAKKETRYGFGRQGRLSLVFTGHRAPAWLRREIARHSDARLIDAEALVG